MKLKKGKIIVIEGGDSSGKEVQSRLLAKALVKKGYSVKFMDFPKYDHFFGKIVGRYLSGEFGDVKDIHPVLSSLAYALDRFKSKDQMLKALTKGQIIICNRFVGSNLAYMSAKLPIKKRPEYINWNEEMEHDRLGTPREDLAIFLHVPPKFGQKLTYAKDEKVYMKGKGRGDIHERNLKYLNEVTKQYFWLAKNRKHYAVIESMAGRSSLRPIDEIHQEIMKILEAKKII